MGVYELYEDIYKLKNLLRSGWTKRHAHSKLGRVESDAEHTFSMAILALKIIQDRNLNLDQGKVLKLVIYHELCEIEAGDITPFDGVSQEDKYMREYTSVKKLSEKHNMPEIFDYWIEFEQAYTPESRFAREMDKLDAIMQAKIYARETNNPKLFEEFKTYSYDIYKKYAEYVDEKIINTDSTRNPF